MKKKSTLGSTPPPAHIAEAQRYIANAKKLLTENGKKDGNLYQDKKYVRMAGNTLWNGVLEALDGTLHVRDKAKKGSRVDKKNYQEAIAKVDKKMGKTFENAYETIHLNLGYDGNLDYRIVKIGFVQAQEVIDWCLKHSK